MLHRFFLLLPVVSLYNLSSIFSQTKADKSFSSVYYHDRVKMLREVYIEKEKHFTADFSLKYTPTDGSKNASEGNFKYDYRKNYTFNSILQSYTERVRLILVKVLINYLEMVPFMQC